MAMQEDGQGEEVRRRRSIRRIRIITPYFIMTISRSDLCPDQNPSFRLQNPTLTPREPEAGLKNGFQNWDNLLTPFFAVPRLQLWGPNPAPKPLPSCLGAIFFWAPFLKPFQDRYEEANSGFCMGRLSKIKVWLHAKKHRKW